MKKIRTEHIHDKDISCLLQNGVFWGWQRGRKRPPINGETEAEICIRHALKLSFKRIDVLLGAVSLGTRVSVAAP
jgi:hypothetical protein